MAHHKRDAGDEAYLHKRETLMERRLRAARGERDDAANLDNDGYDGYDDDDGAEMPAEPRPRPRDAEHEHHRRRRESIMERRLRVARGEIDDEHDEDDDAEAGYPHTHTWSDSPRAAGYGGTAHPSQKRRRPPPQMYMVPISRESNWMQSLLYLVLGTIALLFIVLYFFGDDLRLFERLKPALFNPAPQISNPIAEPTPTMRLDAPTVLQRVQRLSRLQVTSYTFEKVIEGSVQGNALQNLLMGDRLLLIANGNVTAGIDLNQLTVEDITVSEDGQTAVIYLPPVEIFSVGLDNSRTRVVSREQGLLADPNPDLETNARQVAEAEIYKAACESGIMQRATEDSQHAMAQFLSMLDFQQVEVVAAPVPTCPDLESLQTTP